MRDRSYQQLQDATSFVILSDKNTEKLEGEYSNKIGFSILAAFCMEFSYANEVEVTSQPHLHMKTLCRR